MEENRTKICPRCKESKPMSKFGKRTVNGRVYPASSCYSCREKRRSEMGWRSEEAKDRERQRISKLKKKQRNDPAYRAKHIVTDSAKTDRRKGHFNDLDIEFVEGLIELPCAYCEATDIRMTLDRIDNDVGHTKDNVIQSCYRCNLTRGNMPAEAWKFLCEGMREARIAGAFGDWGASAFSRKS